MCAEFCCGHSRSRGRGSLSLINPARGCGCFRIQRPSRGELHRLYLSAAGQVEVDQIPTSASSREVKKTLVCETGAVSHTETFISKFQPSLRPSALGLKCG
uniref:Uncharacterized protein n=1 Tax=Knipowitschia caucasica TaxID=637954 RepID=A0AAV2KXN8_KNICA